MAAGAAAVAAAAAAAAGAGAPDAEARGAKRGRCGEEGPAGAAVAPAAAPPAAAPPQSEAARRALHLPLVEDVDPPVLVRVYGAADGGGGGGGGGSAGRGFLPKINDVVEVVGIYTVDPCLTSWEGAGGAGGAGGAEGEGGRGAGGGADEGEGEGQEEDMAGGGAPSRRPRGEGAGAGEEAPEERAARVPPGSAAPRLQALCLRRLSPDYPLLQPPPAPAASSGAFALQPAGADEPAGPSPCGSPGASSRGARAVARAAGSAEAPGSAGGAPPPPAGPSDVEVLRAAALRGLAALGAGAPAAPAARAQALALLAGCLGGDALAAEYTLLHLLSSVTLRQGGAGEGGRALGKLSLTLSGAPDASEDPATRGLQASIATPARAPAGGGAHPPAPAPPPRYHALLPLAAGASACGRALGGTLAALLPRTALLPLRIDNLNALAWAPAKGGDDEKLAAGLLQVRARRGGAERQGIAEWRGARAAHRAAAERRGLRGLHRASVGPLRAARLCARSCQARWPLFGGAPHALPPARPPPRSSPPARASSATRRR